MTSKFLDLNQNNCFIIMIIFGPEMIKKKLGLWNHILKKVIYNILPIILF